MTLKEYSKMSGLNVLKVYNYSKYSNNVTNRLRYMTFKELPFCLQLTIRQVLTNLRLIAENKTALPISNALQKSAFKIYSKGFLNNIMDGFNVNSKHNIDNHLDIDHVKKLVKVTEEFISFKIRNEFP